MVNRDMTSILYMLKNIEDLFCLKVQCVTCCGVECFAQGGIVQVSSRVSRVPINICKTLSDCFQHSCDRVT